MIKELIPTIDSSFRTIADRERRVMAGLSMGGMQTFQITLKNLDKFAYIGGFSGAGGGMGRGAAFDVKRHITACLAMPRRSTKRSNWSG